MLASFGIQGTSSSFTTVKAEQFSHTAMKYGTKILGLHDQQGLHPLGASPRLGPLVKHGLPPLQAALLPAGA